MSQIELERERDLDRFLTFVDAVVAIAITLLVASAGRAGDPRSDDGSVTELPAARPRGDELLGFFLSFAVDRALLWLAQHETVSSLVRQSDRPIVSLLLLWLLTIVVLPFPTALVAEAGNRPRPKSSTSADHGGQLAAADAGGLADEPASRASATGIPARSTASGAAPWSPSCSPWLITSGGAPTDGLLAAAPAGARRPGRGRLAPRSWKRFEHHPCGKIGRPSQANESRPCPRRPRPRPATTDPAIIRNFCIIAHIDHGKSTLADRMLQLTGVVDERAARAQYLDRMDIERERGITIKSQAVRMPWTVPADNEQGAEPGTYVLNMIDTPGHVDFTYEVSRSLEACEAAVLLVDAAQGIEAQTLANLYLALGADLHIIPVLNKIDLPSAQPEKYAAELAHIIGCDPADVLQTSAKTGLGVEALLNEIVKQTPAPVGDADAPARALIFDSVYDTYRGVVTYVRVVDGKLSHRDRIKMMSTGAVHEMLEVGVISPEPVKGTRDRRRRGRLPDHRREGRPPVPGR